MDEPPADFPATRPDGSPLKPITQVLLDRRATVSFASDEVPAEVLEAILRFGAQAPSGYNLQPWRFIVVRDRANRALKTRAIGASLSIRRRSAKRPWSSSLLG